MEEVYLNWVHLIVGLLYFIMPPIASSSGEHLSQVVGVSCFTGFVTKELEQRLSLLGLLPLIRA